MRGIAFSVREKEWALRMWLTEHKDVYKVARKLRCSADTIRRWRRLWDGTRESLQNKSHRPHTPHPNATQKKNTDILCPLSCQDGGKICSERHFEPLKKFF